jgi:flagellar hook assembly protein FlgD
MARSLIVRSAELPAASLNFKSCYPNPSISVQIVWEQKNPEPVQLSVYNLKGQLVKQIFCGTKGSGEQSTTWDGADSQNQKVSSGIYFLRLQSGNKVQTRKLVKLR